MSLKFREERIWHASGLKAWKSSPRSLQQRGSGTHLEWGSNVYRLGSWGRTRDESWDRIREAGEVRKVTGPASSSFLQGTWRPWPQERWWALCLPLPPKTQALRGLRGLNSLSFHGVPGRAELTPWSPRAYAIISLQVRLSWPGEHPAPWAACRPQVGTMWAPSWIRRSSPHLPPRAHASSSSGPTCCPVTPGLLSTDSLADSLQKHLRNRQ